MGMQVPEGAWMSGLSENKVTDRVDQILRPFGIAVSEEKITDWTEGKLTSRAEQV